MSELKLPRTSPAQQQVSASKIMDFLDSMEQAPVELHSLMIVRHGQVVAEGWWHPYAADRLQLLYSLSKSFTSTAAGLAVEEGRLDLEAPVLSYFPEFDDVASHPWSRTMKVRHLASMSTGHLEDALERAYHLDPAEPVRGFFGVPPEAEPGSIFAYNNIATYVLAAIVAKVTQTRLLDYLRPRLFEPLGIAEAAWLEHPAGRTLGFSGLHLTTESVAKFGQLYLDRGGWAGTQLIPAEWVDQATRLQTPNPNEPSPDWQQGYGFQFWMAEHGYRGDGAYGQFCIVLPQQDAVIVTTAASEDMQVVLDAVWAHLLPAFDAPDLDQGAHPSDSAAALTRRLSELVLPRRSGEPAPNDPAAWSSLTFTPTAAARAVFMVDSLALEPSNGQWQGVLTDAADALAFSLGDSGWAVSEPSTSDGAVLPVAATVVWTDDDTAVVDVVFLDTPHHIALTCSRAPRTFEAAWHTAPLHTPKPGHLRAPRT